MIESAFDAGLADGNPRSENKYPGRLLIGEELVAVGADGFCAINTIPSIMGFDLATLNPKTNVDGHTAPGGYSGYGITTFDKLDMSFRTRAQVDLLKCIRCSKCKISCQDSGYQAITMPTSGSYPQIDPDKCVGCSRCAHVCPVSAIHMIQAT